MCGDRRLREIEYYVRGISRRKNKRMASPTETSQVVGGSGTEGDVGEYVVPLAVVNEAPGVTDTKVTNPVSLKSATALPAVLTLPPAPRIASRKN